MANAVSCRPVMEWPGPPHPAKERLLPLKNNCALLLEAFTHTEHPLGNLSERPWAVVTFMSARPMCLAAKLEAGVSSASSCAQGLSWTLVKMSRSIHSHR